MALNVDKLNGAIQARSSVADQAGAIQIESHQVAIAVGAESFVSQRASVSNDMESHDKANTKPIETKKVPALSEQDNPSSIEIALDTQSDQALQPDLEDAAPVEAPVKSPVKPPVKPLQDADAGHRSVFKIDDPTRQGSSESESKLTEPKSLADELDDVLPISESSQDEVAVAAPPEIVQPETTFTGSVPLPGHSDTNLQATVGLSLAPAANSEPQAKTPVVADSDADLYADSLLDEAADTLSVNLVSSAMGPELAPDEFSQFEDKSIAATPATPQASLGESGGLSLEPLESDEPLASGKDTDPT